MSSRMSGMIAQSQRNAARDHCRRTSPGLLFAAGLLPRTMREAAWCVWAVIKQLNDILEPVAPPATEAGGEGGCCGGESIEQRAAVCESVLDYLFSGEATGKGELDGFHAAAEQFGLHRPPMSAMVEATAAAAGPKRIATWQRLRQNARQITEPVTLDLFRAFGEQPTGAQAEQAAAWASSIWLASQLGDFARHLRAGRLTLPLDDLVKFSVRESEVASFMEAGTSGGDARWRSLIEHHVERIALMHRGGAESLRLLRPEVRRAAATFGALMMARLDLVVEAGGDVFAAGLPELTLWQRMTRLPGSLRSIRALGV